MKLIVGLGNPGREYAGTRHNIGFGVIADKYHISLNSKEHKAVCGKGFIEGEKVILAQPQTFMNLSGESVRSIADYYKIEPEDIIVAYDDIDLEVAQKRKRRRAQWHQKYYFASWNERISTCQSGCRGEATGRRPCQSCIGTFFQGR